MKVWGLMLILLFMVAALCIYDGINNKQSFDYMVNESTELYESITVYEDISSTTLDRAKKLNTYWTEKMDTLSVSISRKDLQPISDYLQYLISAIENSSIEDAKTYSRLLNYNVIGIQETTGFTIINIL